MSLTDIFVGGITMGLTLSLPFCYYLANISEIKKELKAETRIGRTNEVYEGILKIFAQYVTTGKID